MTRLAGALSCAFLLSAAAAQAQDAAPPPVQIPGAAPVGQRPPPRERRGPPHARLFISPSGQPFRTEDGLGAWLAQADTNHDGVVSRAEFRADAEAWFRTLDANHDGMVDGFEITAYEHEIVPEITQLGDDGPGGGERPAMSRRGRGGGMGRGGMGRGGGGMGGRHGGASDGAPGDTPTSGGPARMKPAGRLGAARYSLINEPEPVLAADTNIDGRVSQDEWMKATARRFELLDKAHVGQLTRDSLVAPRPDGK